jgi:hypothetical protein
MRAFHTIKTVLKSMATHIEANAGSRLRIAA